MNIKLDFRISNLTRDFAKWKGKESNYVSCSLLGELPVLAKTETIRLASGFTPLAMSLGRKTNKYDLNISHSCTLSQI